MSTHDVAVAGPIWPRILLRVSLTVAAVLLLSQSITAGLFMSELRAAFPVHRELATAAGIALMVAVVAAVICARRGGGWWPVWATIGMLGLMSLQAFAGYRSLTALHVPLGVVTIVAGIALALWSWAPPAHKTSRPASTANVRESTRA